MELSRSVEPFFPCPLTDLAQGLVSYTNRACNPLEIKMLNCLEAYGQRIGSEKCKDLLEDFKECTQRDKQHMRIMAMEAERARQYKAGERKKKYADTPPLDLY